MHPEKRVSVEWSETMTAISRIYTAEGFVVASDSKEINTLKPDEVREDVQKIFPLTTPGLALSCAVAGTARLTDADGVAFDFTKEVSVAGAAIADGKSRSWPEYVAALTRAISKRMDAARQSSSREIFGSVETHIFLNGFYRRHPRSARVLFKHELKQSRSECHVETPEKLMLYGSNKLWPLLFAEDSRFASFIIPSRAEATTLSVAIERACNEVRAHSDEAARELDEENWRAVGGPVHIATVTSVEGFNWVPRFKPSQPEVS